MTTKTEWITRETAMELAENAGFEHVNHIKFRGRYNKCTVNEKFEIDCFQRICELAYQKALNDTLEADAVATTALAQPAKPMQDEPSPTAEMNIAQRILHVGGRENAAGYIEFGSIQAVNALVKQAIRDLPTSRPLPDHEIVTLYDESPTGDSDMIKFARAIESANNIKETL
jgi:hypothetical protein